MTTAKRARQTAKRRRRAQRSMRQQTKRLATAARAAAIGDTGPALARRSYALVAGEHPELVLEGVVAYLDSGRVVKGPDGTARVCFQLPSGADDLTMGPFVRALMRVEAEMLAREADELASVTRMRSDEERRGAAVILLTRRICEEIERERRTMVAA